MKSRTAAYLQTLEDKATKQRSEVAKKRIANKTPKERSESALRREANKTSEQRSEAINKGWKTRRNNDLLKLKEGYSYVTEEILPDDRMHN